MGPKKIKAALCDTRLRSKAKRSDMIKQKMMHCEKLLWNCISVRVVQSYKTGAYGFRANVLHLANTRSLNASRKLIF